MPPLQPSDQTPDISVEMTAHSRPIVVIESSLAFHRVKPNTGNRKFDQENRKWELKSSARSALDHLRVKYPEAVVLLLYPGHLPNISSAHEYREILKSPQIPNQIQRTALDELAKAMTTDSSFFYASEALSNISDPELREFVTRNAGWWIRTDEGDSVHPEAQVRRRLEHFDPGRYQPVVLILSEEHKFGSEELARTEGESGRGVARIVVTPQARITPPRGDVVYTPQLGNDIVSHVVDIFAVGLSLGAAESKQPPAR